jgi:cardiolipin synthase C
VPPHAIDQRDAASASHRCFADRIEEEAGLCIESPELAERLTAYMATGVVAANGYRVLLDPTGSIVWETVRDGEIVRCRDEPETGFRPRFVGDRLKLLPIDSQL